MIRFHTPIPVTRSLAHPPTCGAHSECVEYPSRAGVLVIPTVPIASTSVPHPKHQGRYWLTHIYIHIWPLFSPLVRLLLPSPRRLGQSSHLSPTTPPSTTTSRVGASGSRTWSWNPRPSCSTRFLHPSDGISRGVRFLERAWLVHGGRLTLDGCFYLDSIQQQATPAYSEYSFVPSSTQVSVSAEPRRYYRHKPAPPSLKSYTHVEIPRLGVSTWGHNNRYSPLCDKRSECSRRSRRRHSRAL